MPGTFPHDWPITFYKYNNDCRHHDQSETIPPYPSVILGIWRVEESVLFHYDYEDDYSPEGDLNPPCSRGTVDGEIEIELRLCIIPVGVELRAEAALRVTISVDLSIPILNSVSLKGFFLKGFLPTSIPCSINYCAVDGDYSGQNYRVWRNTPSLVMPLEKYFVNRNTEFCRSCIFIPIKGVVLQDWLDRSDWFDAADLWWNYPTHVRWLGCSILQTYCPDNFSPFKSNTIAAALYRCLFEVTAVNLFDLLERKCSQLVCLFEGAVSRAKASDTANIVRFKDRIQQTLDDGSR